MSGPSGPRLTRRGRTWYGAFYVGGIRHIRSTKCTDRKAAATIVAQWERDAADPDRAAQDQATLNDALERLVRERASQALAGKRSEQTVAFYRKKAGVLLHHLGRDLRLARIDARVVDDYSEKRRFDGAAENTIAKELATLRASLKLCKRRKLWVGDVQAVMPVGFETQYQPRTRFLTVPEMQRLLPQLPSKHAAVVAFIVATGADWSAVARATRGDVASDLMMCTIHGSKNRYRRNRLVPIATHEQRTLLGYALAHADGVGGALFGPWINVRRDLRAACARAGVLPVSPNDLRRTFGTWLRQQGVDPSLIAPAMGHADSRMVERVYGRLPPEDLRDQIAAAVSVHAGLLPVCTGNQAPCVAKGSITGVSDGSKIDAPDGLGGLTNPQFPAGFVRRGGIEPPTRGFSVPCSTN